MRTDYEYRGYENDRIPVDELPKEVRRAIDHILGDMEEGITEGRAPSDYDELSEADYNVIPAMHKGLCAQRLLTYCYDKDSFEGRILESLDHAMLKCPGINREIYYLTTQWDSRIINKQAGYIESVRRNGIEIIFIHICRKGYVRMPV